MQAANNIFLVRVPTQEAVDGRELRDYILESLERGVLVLTEDASCEVLELPPLGEVAVVEPPETTPAREPEEGNTPAPAGSDAEVKQAIIQRLKAYRTAQGLGSLEALSVKTAHQKGKRVSAETLRNICGDGAPKMPLEDWLKIEKALNTLEQKRIDRNGQDRG